MINLSRLVTTVARQLYDEQNTDWSADELVTWVEEALGAIGDLRPDLVTEEREVTLDPGARQEKPSDAARVINVLGTKSEQGDEPSSVSTFDIRVMRATAPGWERATPNPIARQFALSADHTAYWLYPPQPDPAGYGDIEVIPAFDLPRSGDSGYNSHTITLDSRFARALVDYALYRAYSKDMDAAAQGDRANLHLQAFNQALGLQQGGS